MTAPLLIERQLVALLEALEVEDGLEVGGGAVGQQGAEGVAQPFHRREDHLQQRLRLAHLAVHHLHVAGSEEAIRVLIVQLLRHYQPEEKKTTLGWVANGERRHAERQGELIPCG
jgi:hypothetical protein